MKAIIYNQRISGLKKEDDVMAIKLSYLLANTTVATAEIAGFLQQHKLIKKLTTVQKLAVIEANVKVVFDDDENNETAIRLSGFCQTLRILEKRKHTNREAFLEFKRCEKLLIAPFDETNGLTHVNLEELGYVDLYQLLDNKALTTDLLELSIMGGAWIKKTDEQIANKLLNLFCGKNDGGEPSIIILKEGLFGNSNTSNFHFLTKKIKKTISNNETTSTTPAEEKSGKDEIIENDPTFLRMLKLPFLGHINSSELKTIRGQINENILELNNTIDSFINLVKSSTDVKAIEDFLITECWDAVIKMRVALKENELLTSLGKTLGQTMAIEPMLSYTQTSHLFLLLYRFEMIPYAVSAIIQEKLNDPATAHNYPKFLAFITPTSMPVVETEEDYKLLQPSSAPAKKKTISLD